MRALRVLLIGFGVFFGLLIAAVALLAEWGIAPYEANCADIGVADTYGTLAAIAIVQPSLYYPVVFPLLGALVGWVAAGIAGRRGWQLARGGSGPEKRGELRR